MPNSVMDYTIQLNNQQELLEYAAQVAGDGNSYALMNRINAIMRQNPYTGMTHDEQFADALYKIIRENGYDIEYNGNNQWSAGVFQRTAETVTQNPVNSNITSISRGNLRQMYGTINEFDGTHTFMQMTRYPVSGGMGTKALYTLGSIAQAGAAVSTGIWLGKTIDSALYNINPDYWDSIGLSTLNPDTWNSITNGDDSAFAGLFNFILGLDPDSGKAQMYMNQDALAYMAYALKQNGWFSQAGSEVISYDSSITTRMSKSLLPTPIPFITMGTLTGIYLNPTTPTSNVSVVCTIASSTEPVYAYYVKFANDWNILPCFCSAAPFTIRKEFTYLNGNTNVETYNSSQVSYNSNVYYQGAYSSANRQIVQFDVPTYTINTSTYNSNAVTDVASLIVKGQKQTIPSIAGVGNQPNATLPNVSDWNSLSDVLPSLQQQYPDAFNDAMVWNNDQPYADSTGNTATYIPVPFPDLSSMLDTRPTSGTQTQTDTDTSTLPDNLVDLLMKFVQQTQTDTASQTVPQNPITTGTGTSPTPVTPSGSASALWSVYHPTQAQVNSFGAWLWTDNIITQIQQVLQNPMEGIITLHKVFATPIDSGTGTIVVGRLDSEVPSATVTQQYVEVNCGSVNCYEQFGNVFDYDPFTTVSLFLPFIGIVPLNVSDVMRSTITVKYGVDVFTGACLAMVEVSRDGNTVNMYQYAGVASVEYPLTGSVHSGLISGLLGLASGAAGLAMASTGVGAVAGIATMAGGMASAGKSNNARSGGFAGNSGAMGIKTPYLIIERPQTKVADLFPSLSGYPTNVSNQLKDFSGQVNVSYVHVEGINATDVELKEIESLLKSGVLV